MNLKIRRILCATDLNDNSDYIFRYAVRKACEENAKLIVTHILNQRSIKIAKTIAYLLNKPQEAILKEKVDAALKRMKKQLTLFYQHELKDHPEYANRIEYMIVHHGNVAEEIVEKADRFGCDAIIIGSHGKSVLKFIRPSRITKKVLKRTQIPVQRAT
jgi:nucleotide-binding universal stress UspA family protein